MDQPKRKLKINMAELVDAFDHMDPYSEIQYYLDVETGEVTFTTGEDLALLEAMGEEIENEEVDSPDSLQRSDLADWQKDAIELKNRIQAGLGTRYLSIPHLETSEEYNMMVDFIGTVKNRRLQEILDYAIQGKGAFRRFKDVLLNYPEERERWFKFRYEITRLSAMEWLEDEGIELIETV
jgi:hypothetical protein